MRSRQETSVKPWRRSAGARTMSRCAVALTWILGGVIALVAIPAAAAPAAVADRVLRVEVAEGIENAADMPGWIAERNPDLAQEIAEAPGRERWIAVEIEGEYLDFRYRVVPMRDGQAVGEEGEWLTCSCSNDDLLAKIDEGIATAVEELQAPVDSRGEVSPTQEPRSSSAQREPTYRKMTVVGTAGIVVGAVGVGAVGAGAVLMGLGERVPGDYLHLERDYRPPGVAFLVGGGLALGAGVAMLVTDLVQCRRRHRRCLVEDKDPAAAGAARSRSIAIVPWLGARGVGLSGRF